MSGDVKGTFNMVSVDGDTSTNDMVVVMANGQAGNPCVDKEGEDFDTFMKALNTVTVAHITVRQAVGPEGAVFKCVFRREFVRSECKGSVRHAQRRKHVLLHVPVKALSRYRLDNGTQHVVAEAVLKALARGEVQRGLCERVYA